MNPLDFFKQFMGPDDLVFDVGANIGEMTEIFAQLSHRVIAFEPVMESYTALCDKFCQNQRVALDCAALGAEEGFLTVATSKDAPTIGVASMSPGWIDAVSRSGRFGANHWTKSENVSVTTLDRCIRRFGLPAFIKIDVEGYEPEVLAGLSQPVKALSFEFTPEQCGKAAQCVGYCEGLGMTKFNLSLMQEYQLGEWVTANEICDRLSGIKGNVIYGDVYARSYASRSQ